MHQRKVVLALVVAVCLTVAAGLRAQEHPKSEHPKQEHPKEQTKEHPSAKAITTADLEKTIKEKIAKKAEKAGGKFPAQDNVMNKTWALELVRVHTDKLAQLDANTYFACVDFKAEDGTMVDVDFFLKSEGGKLRFTETTVHKINGQARYSWQEKGGFWEKVKAGN